MRTHNMFDHTRSQSPFRRLASRRSAFAYGAIAVTVFLFFSIFVALPYPQKYDIPSDIAEHVVDIAKTHLPDVHSKQGSKHQPSLSDITSKYAYATFLGPSVVENEQDINDDKYFVAARLLAYQLLHAPQTKTTHNLPLIVLVSTSVAEEKKERLRTDGAIVWEREGIDADWIETSVPGWRTVLTKLRLWELTQFERICFLDGDTVLAQSMDSVFQDPAIISRVTGSNKDQAPSDEAVQPKEYVFAAVQEISPVHDYPPTEENHGWPNMNYLNAGFFVMQPRTDMLEHYLSVLAIPHRYDAGLPEQNLFNYVHRPEGNMPWKALDVSYNMHFATKDDLDGGLRSLHSKFWHPEDERLSPFLQSWRWRMEGFHQARDRYLFESESF